MKNFFLGLVLGIVCTGTSAHAIGIGIEGVTVRSLIAVVLMAGTQSDRASAYSLAEKLIAGK